MDRKTHNILSEISDIRSDLNEIKSEQTVGQDNPRLRLISEDNDFDLEETMAAGSDLNVFSQFIYGGADLKPWQETAYVQIFFQLWVDDLGSPWEGYIGGINIVAYEEEAGDTVTDSLRLGIKNNDSIDHTIFMKFWAITSSLGGAFSVSVL